MRRVATLAMAIGLLAASVTGCGDRSLILKVNVLSFLDSSERTVNYSVPGGTPSVTVDVADETVNLLQGVNDATDIASATLDIAASFDNRAGTASGNLLFYAVPSDTTPVFSSTPIASIPISLTPGNITNVSATVSSDALAAALVSDRARIGLRISLDTSATPALQNVSGTETLTQLLATVVTKKKV